MEHQVTAEIVQAIYSEESALVVGGKTKTPAEARQGTRTRVHELLQAQVPCAYVLPAPSRQFGPDERVARNEDIAKRKQALQASIPNELILESERARSGPDGTHRDAVHYLQKKYGKALWEETDKLVNQVLGGGAS